MKRIIRYIMGWVETWRIMRNKELMESIRRAQKDIEEGRCRFLSHEEVFGGKSKNGRLEEGR